MASNSNPQRDPHLDDPRFMSYAPMPAPMSEDWYHGHKVVAYPGSAFGGMSIREVVSERNESLAQNDNNQHRPRRSNSLGRQPIRPGRDIIQDIYDRMGVNYTAGGGGGYEDSVPLQRQPSFSDSCSDFTNNSSGIVSASYTSPFQSNGRPVNHANSSSKIRDKFSGRYRAAAAATSRTTPDRGRTRPDNTVPQNRGRTTETRGRTVEPQDETESEGRRRARSLSRGQSVRGMWPPPKDNQPMEDTPVVRLKQQSSASQNGGPVGQQDSPPRKQYQMQSKQLTVAPSSPEGRPKSPLKRSHSLDARPQYGGGLRSKVATPGGTMLHQNKLRTSHMGMEVSVPSSMREEKKDSDDRSVASTSEAIDELTQPSSIPSIKDRISVFAGNVKATPPSAQRQQRRNTYGGSNAPGSKYIKPAAPPPKVDIYARSPDESAPPQHHPDDPDNVENQGSSVMDAAIDDFQLARSPESSNIPPSAAATAAAETAAKYMRPSQMVQSKKAAAAASRQSPGVARSSIVNSYLNGLQSSTVANNAASNRSCFQQQPAPVADISNNSPHGTEEIIGGVANVFGVPLSDERLDGGKSSIPHGDTTNSSGRKLNVWRKPGAGQFASNVPANQGVSNNGTTNSPNKDNLTVNGPSAEIIERMVDERVQAQLREVEARMEGLLRRWMDQMNTKISYRLDAMEASIRDSMPGSLPRAEI